MGIQCVHPRPPLFLTILLIGMSHPSCTESSDYFGMHVPRHGPDELWINNSSEPEYIDPGKCSETTGGTIVQNIFAGLTQPHPKSLEPMPDIARSWRIEDGGRTYTFYLRATTWSDGTPLTAEDFAWSWKRTLDPKTASKYASFLYPIRYGEPFNRRAILVKGLPQDIVVEELQAYASTFGKIERVVLAPELQGAFVYPVIESTEDVDGAASKRQAFIDGLSRAWNGATLSAEITPKDIVGVRALDDLTLRLDLMDPLPFILDILKFYTAMPVPRHLLERLEGEGKDPDLWTRPEYIVSNGPYVLKQWEFRQFMVLEKNEHYWDAAHVRTPRIKVEMINSYNTTLDVYKAGYIDWVGESGDLPSEFTDSLKNFKDYHSDTYLGVYFYYINTKIPPMDDPRVREAMSLAIDRKAITDYVTRAGQIPTADVVPDGLAGYDQIHSELFNPTKAKALLKDVGYGEGGKELPSVTLKYNTTEGHKKIAEAVQQMWKKHLGISVTLENQEWNVYQKTLLARDFQIARMGWIGDYADPYTFLELFTAANGNNRTGWSNPRYEALLRKGNGDPDPKKRIAILRQAEAVLQKHRPVIPIYFYTASQMWKPYFRGIWPNLQDRHPFKYMYIDERWREGEPTDPGPILDESPPTLYPDPPPQDHRSDH